MLDNRTRSKFTSSSCGSRWEIWISEIDNFAFERRIRRISTAVLSTRLLHNSLCTSYWTEWSLVRPLLRICNNLFMLYFIPTFYIIASLILLLHERCSYSPHLNCYGEYVTVLRGVWQSVLRCECLPSAVPSWTVRWPDRAAVPVCMWCLYTDCSNEQNSYALCRLHHHRGRGFVGISQSI